MGEGEGEGTKGGCSAGAKGILGRIFGSRGSGWGCRTCRSRRSGLGR